LRIAQQHKMVAINSAIGVDLHGNIWADSLKGRQIYSGIGGQADFLRGSVLSKEGYAIIAMESMTNNGISKNIDMCPEGITTTAIAADPVIIVTENGAFNPMGLNLVEHAIGIAHLAEPKTRENLLRKIYDSPEFYKSKAALSDKTPKGFTPYEAIEK
jgi:acyl-CoA hydrolase